MGRTRMSRKHWVVVGVLAIVLAQPIVAFAGSWQVQGRGGVSIPTGDFGDKDKFDAGVGYLAGGALDYVVNERFAVGVDGSFLGNKHGAEGETVNIGGGATFTTSKDDFTTWQLGARGKLMMPANTIAPYLMAGVGVYSTKEKWEGTGTDGSGGTFSASGEDNTDTRIGGKVGAGALFKVNDVVGIGVDADYNFISQDKDKVGVSSLQYLGVGASVVFNVMPR